MFEQLFGSKTRVKILNLLLNNDDRSFYVREITRRINEQINSVRRELDNLKKLDIVSCRAQNGKLYYTINKHFELYPEMKQMFKKIAHELSEENKLAKDMKKIGTIRYAALMGKFVKDQSNKIDLFIVGDLDKRKFNALVSKMEKDLGSEVNYTVISYEEYRDRKMLFDRFITEIFSVPQDIMIDRLEN